MRHFWYDNNFFKDPEDVVKKYRVDAESTQDIGNKLLLSGERKQLTEEQKQKAKSLGLSEESISRLLLAGTEHDEPDAPTAPKDVFKDKYIIKPDPKGWYYFKAYINGKTVVKPLSDKLSQAKVLRDKYLEQYNLS